MSAIQVVAEHQPGSPVQLRATSSVAATIHADVFARIHDAAGLHQTPNQVPVSSTLPTRSNAIWL